MPCRARWSPDIAQWRAAGAVFEGLAGWVARQRQDVGGLGVKEVGRRDFEHCLPELVVLTGGLTGVEVDATGGQGRSGQGSA